VIIVFDDFPQQIGWLLTSLDLTVVGQQPAGTYTPGTPFTVETLELIPGDQYLFTIQDTAGDGLCCSIPGTYVIAAGNFIIASNSGNFGFVDTALFTVPFP
jgi:hypothetical protein